MHNTNDANGKQRSQRPLKARRKDTLQTHPIKKRNENNLVGQARSDVIK
jgi:hypothetical protein